MTEFEEVTEGEEVEHKEKLKTKWAQLEAMVGTEKRIEPDRRGPGQAFRERRPAKAMDGKAMIVCMSRRICVDLYKAIVKLRPDWHHDDDDKGIIKIVMTGSASDPAGLAAPHPQQAAAGGNWPSGSRTPTTRSRS